MLKNISAFLIGLSIGTTYPNQVRTLINTTLSFIQKQLKNAQLNLAPLDDLNHTTTKVEQRVDYEKLKKEAQNIAKNLDEDWR